MRIFKSRKFWATFAGVVALVAAALGGEMTWADAIGKGVILVMTYVAAIGVVDTAAELKGGKV